MSLSKKVVFHKFVLDARGNWTFPEVEDLYVIIPSWSTPEDFLTWCVSINGNFDKTKCWRVSCSSLSRTSSLLAISGELTPSYRTAEVLRIIEIPEGLRLGLTGDLLNNFGVEKKSRNAGGLGHVANAAPSRGILRRTSQGTSPPLSTGRRVSFNETASTATDSADSALFVSSPASPVADRDQSEEISDASGVAANPVSNDSAEKRSSSPDASDAGPDSPVESPTKSPSPTVPTPTPTVTATAPTVSLPTSTATIQSHPNTSPDSATFPGSHPHSPIQQPIDLETEPASIVSNGAAVAQQLSPQDPPIINLVSSPLEPQEEHLQQNTLEQNELLQDAELRHELLMLSHRQQVNQLLLNQRASHRDPELCTNVQKLCEMEMLHQLHQRHLSEMLHLLERNGQLFLKRQGQQHMQRHDEQRHDQLQKQQLQQLKSQQTQRAEHRKMLQTQLQPKPLNQQIFNQPISQHSRHDQGTVQSSQVTQQTHIRTMQPPHPQTMRKTITLSMLNDDKVTWGKARSVVADVPLRFQSPASSYAFFVYLFPGFFQIHRSYRIVDSVSSNRQYTFQEALFPITTQFLQTGIWMIFEARIKGAVAQESPEPDYSEVNSRLVAIETSLNIHRKETGDELPDIVRRLAVIDAKLDGIESAQQSRKVADRSDSDVGMSRIESFEQSRKRRNDDFDVNGTGITRKRRLNEHSTAVSFESSCGQLPRHISTLISSLKSVPEVTCSGTSYGRFEIVDGKCLLLAGSKSRWKFGFDERDLVADLEEKQVDDNVSFIS